MRVLLVADVVGGVRTFVRELVAELLGRGIEVDLALIGRESADLGQPAVRSCELRDLRLEWMPEPWDDVAATAEWVEELRRRFHPDVLHMNTFTPVLDPEVPVVLTVHSCVLTWWRGVHGTEAPGSWATYRRAADRALKRAGRVVVPTRALLRELEAVHGRLARACVVPNGRRVPLPSAAERRERLVISAGRIWDQAKNAALVAEAAPRIDGRVVLIGEGAVPGPGVEHVGAISESALLEWFSRASVFAEPARYEPFGLAALEAALCGCALVLGDVPSLHEVWGDAAAYVGADDPSRLAREVNSLLDDPAHRARAAGRARARALTHCPARMADGYMALYGQLARVPVVA